MKKQILAISAIALLAACQNEERGNNKTATDMNSEDAMASGEEVLAERDVPGAGDMGADINGDGDATEDIDLPPETRYATYYLGSYAPEGECAGPEKYVELEQAKITYSGTECRIKSVENNGNSVSVTTEKCTKDGKAASGTSYALELSDLENLSISGSESATMKRCGSG